MTKKMIKAVRLVCGYSDDLRVKLPYSPNAYTQQQTHVRDFLLENLLGIYGPGIYDSLGVAFNPIPGKDPADFEKLLQFVERESRAVCFGGPNA